MTSPKMRLSAPNRRQFARRLVAGGLFATAREAVGYRSTAVKAIAFDAFPILDPRPIFDLAETMFPGKGADLAAAWRTRQFEYTWPAHYRADMPIFGGLPKTHRCSQGRC